MITIEQMVSPSLLSKQERIIVGVSGGIDSMVLLHLLLHEGYCVSVAHCNFHLRGEESDADEAFVADISSRWGVPYHSVGFDTQSYAQGTGVSIQVAARELRYRWFEQLCSEHGYEKVAIAHNSDDALETFFINTLRGTGIRGWCGIPQLNGRVVRPLLSCSRRAIEEYARFNQVCYREDSSNSTTKYLRNKIRHQVVPLLREMTSDLNEVMQHNQRCATEVVELLGSFVDEVALRAVVQEDDGSVLIDLQCLEPYSSAGYLLYELLRPWQMEYSVVRDIWSCYTRGVSGRMFYNKNHAVALNRGQLIIAPLAERQENIIRKVLIEVVGRTYRFGDLLYRVDQQEEIPLQMDMGVDSVFVDGDAIEFPLEVRYVNNGDWLVPLGMKGRKKISDLLTEHKMTLSQKAQQAVVTSGGEIVWVGGVRLDDRYKVTPFTKHILKISRTIER